MMTTSVMKKIRKMLAEMVADEDARVHDYKKVHRMMIILQDEDMMGERRTFTNYDNLYNLERALRRNATSVKEVREGRTDYIIGRWTISVTHASALVA